MSATAMADISITGDAKFEYFHTNTDNGTTSTSANKTNTEANLYVRGKSGDTKIFLDLEIATENAEAAALSLDSGDNTGNGDAGDAIDVENAYVTTKLGPIGAKVGNYSTGTSALMGEIDNGSRNYDKMTLDYTVNGIKFYAGNGGNRDIANANDEINNNMFVGVIATVEGWKLQAKKHNENLNAFGASGQAGPVGIRVEYLDGKNDNDTGYFANFTGKFDNINVGLAMIDMKKDGDITEDDSAIFAVENGLADYQANSDSNVQLSASIAVDGTTYAAKIGQIGSEDADVNDRDYYQISAKRAMASGVTLWVGYTDKEISNIADNQTFEVDVSVKF
jgi:hypothetical protein